MLRKSIIVLVAFLLLGIPPLYAAEFFCPSGDVTCLIAAINEAMRTPDDDTIVLEAGSYVLTSVDNITDGISWGLPTTGRAGSGRLTIEGAGMWVTDISRDPNAPEFGLFYHRAFGPGGFRMLHLKNLGLFFGVNGVRAFGGSVRLESVASIANGSGIFGLNTAGFTIQNSYIAFNGTGVTLREAFVRVEKSTIGSNELGIGTNDMFSCVEIFESSIWNNGNGVSGVICSIVNSSITGNGQSGILHIACCGPNPNIDSTTIARNGRFGIMVRGQPGRPRIRLRNTIVAENVEGDCGTLGPFGWLIDSQGHNIIGNTAGCTIEQQPTDLLDQDPRLGEFIDDFGVPGLAHIPLLADSPAIDSGPDTCTEFDQLGNPRVGQCDRGAIEFQG